MNTRFDRTTTQDPLDDEERELMDPDSWDWDNPIEGHTIGTPGAVVRVRFTREEFLALDRIARAAGANPVDLIHQILRDWIAREDDEPSETRPLPRAGAPRAATG